MMLSWQQTEFDCGYRRWHFRTRIKDFGRSCGRAQASVLVATAGPELEPGLWTGRPSYPEKPPLTHGHKTQSKIKHSQLSVSHLTLHSSVSQDLESSGPVPISALSKPITRRMQRGHGLPGVRPRGLLPVNTRMQFGRLMRVCSVCSAEGVRSVQRLRCAGCTVFSVCRAYCMRCVQCIRCELYAVCALSAVCSKCSVQGVRCTVSAVCSECSVSREGGEDNDMLPQCCRYDYWNCYK